MVIKSFNMTGMSNMLFESEDDMIYEDIVGASDDPSNSSNSDND